MRNRIERIFIEDQNFEKKIESNFILEFYFRIQNRIVYSSIHNTILEISMATFDDTFEKFEYFDIFEFSTLLINIEQSPNLFASIN